MNTFIKILFLFLPVLSFETAPAQENRWQLYPPGGIQWRVKPGDIHKDNIEMSGKYLSSVIHYGVNNDGSFYIRRDIVWPMLRTIPNNTHASLTRSFGTDLVRMISINEKNVLAEKVDEILLDGKITVKSSLSPGINLVRTLFPSTNQPVFCEKYVLTNTGIKTVAVEIPRLQSVFRNARGAPPLP